MIECRNYEEFPLFDDNKEKIEIKDEKNKEDDDDMDNSGLKKEYKLPTLFSAPNQMKWDSKKSKTAISKQFFEY